MCVVSGMWLSFKSNKTIWLYIIRSNRSRSSIKFLLLKKENNPAEGSVMTAITKVKVISIPSDSEEYVYQMDRVKRIWYL